MVLRREDSLYVLGSDYRRFRGSWRHDYFPIAFYDGSVAFSRRSLRYRS